MLKKVFTLLIVLVFGITIYGSEIKEITYADGSRYEGEFKDNKINGEGTYTTADGKYEGKFKDGMYNGKGTYIYSDGSKYEGEFKDGRYLGK